MTKESIIEKLGKISSNLTYISLDDIYDETFEHTKERILDTQSRVIDLIKKLENEQ